MRQFTQIIIPELAKHLAKNEREMVQQKLSRFVLSGLILTFLCALAICLLADRLAPLVFGGGFTDIAPAIKWISLAMQLSVFLCAGNVLAAVTGREK